MRFLLPLLAFVVTLQPRPTISAEPPAEQLWRELEAVPWGVPYPQWRNMHSSMACREFRSGTFEHSTQDEWCYRCTQRSDSHLLEWFFYAFGGDVQPVCRLDQFTAHVSGFAPERLGQIHKDLTAKIAGRYGVGKDPGQDLQEFGSAYWRDVLRWRSARLEVLLYLDQVNAGVVAPARVGLLVRNRPLLDTIREDEKLRGIVWNWLERARLTLDLEVSEELGDRFPELSKLLRKLRAESWIGFESDTQGQAHSTILRLLREAQTSPPERQPAILLAADRLAGYLWRMVSESPEWDHQRTELEKLGVRFEWTELGGAWVYTQDLLWRVWRDFPSSDWSDHAFVLLLNNGWDTRVGCQNGSDQFREVIRQGEEYLARHPRSSRRLEVLFAVALAYESWWSLSRATDPDEPYVDPAQYVTGAAAAREKAMGFYEDVIRLSAQSPQASYARRQLPRLKLGLASARIHFYCVYD